MIAHDSFFVQKQNSYNQMGMLSFQKCIIVIRTMACGNNSCDE